MLWLALPLLGHPVHPSSDTQGMVPIPRARPSMLIPPVCKDLDSECLEAAARGACKTAAEFMLTNCRLSCEVCSAEAATSFADKTPQVPSSKLTRECKRLTVGSSAAKGRMRGHRTYCSERYSEDLECQGRRFGFSRLERGRDSWDIIERDFNSVNSLADVKTNEGEPRVVFQGTNVSQASHNAAFLCNEDGTLTTYGGRIKASSRYKTTNTSQSFYHDHYPGLHRTVGKIGDDGSIAWSSPELVLDEQKARGLHCLDMRKGVEVCEFDGKLSATNYRGNTYLFGRANMGKLKNTQLEYLNLHMVDAGDMGGRHVQFSSHPTDDPNSLKPFTSLKFEGYTISNENNIYFMAVMSLRDEMMVGLMPAVIDGQSGIFLSHSETGVLWSKPQLIMESEAVGPRTRDFPVDGFVVEDYRLVFSVDHNIYLEHDDTCDAPPYTCTYEVTGAALLKLLGRASPAEAKAPPTPTTTIAAAETGSCQQGILFELEASHQAATDGAAFACCPASCGSCSGGGCENRPGGMSQCCAYMLVAANEKCRDSTSVACIVPGGQAEAKVYASKVEEPKVRESKVEEPKVEKPKVEAPTVREPKVEEPMVTEPEIEPEIEEPEPEIEIEPEIDETEIEPVSTASPQEKSTVAENGSCQHGILHELEPTYHAATDGAAFACCPAACGSCSGGGCEDRPGGMSQCCAYGLAEANEKCQDPTSVACIVPGGQAEEFARERKKWLPNMP